MFRATSSCIRTAAGPAAAGCPTHSSTATSTPALSNSGSPATASGAVGPAPTGTWSSSASPTRPQANGLRRPTPKLPRRRSSARSPSLKSTRTATVASAFPRCVHDSSGITWHPAITSGQTIPFAQFYIAHPDRDTAATINAQLAQGKNLLFTPGIYDLDRTHPRHSPQYRRPGPRLRHAAPSQRHRRHDTADADGIIIAGLLFDAGARLRRSSSDRRRTAATPATQKIPSPCTTSSSASAAPASAAPTSTSRSTATTPSSITPGSGAPIMAPASAGTRTPATTA